jgi:hypothetical protein
MGTTGEQKIQLRVPEHRSFEGVVTDRNGQPLLGAYVEIKAVEDGERDWKASDEEGRFRFERVFSSHVSISIVKDGYSDLEVGRVEVREAGRPTFTLERESK